MNAGIDKDPLIARLIHSMLFVSFYVAIVCSYIYVEEEVWHVEPAPIVPWYGICLLLFAIDFFPLMAAIVLVWQLKLSPTAAAITLSFSLIGVLLLNLANPLVRWLAMGICAVFMFTGCLGLITEAKKKST